MSEAGELPEAFGALCFTDYSASKTPVFRRSPPTTTHEHESATTSMREATTIEYIVLLMTDSHPAALVDALEILHGSLRDICSSRV